MGRLIALAFAVCFVAGCAAHRPVLPSPDFELQDSSAFFAKPGVPLPGGASSDASR
jgi:hypothetical protein